MPRDPLDTLIVGQGLAGSALAWQRMRCGERVCVIDDGHRSAASAVAAGLVNPLAGMRFNRRPEAGDWLAAAEHWYAALAVEFGRPLFHPRPMLRLFRSPGQRRFYDRRRADPAGRLLLGPAFAADHCPEAVAAPLGGFVQTRTGYVDVPLLLRLLREWLRARDALVEAGLAPGQVRPAAGGVVALGLHARRLVFCDGARLRHNPWFDSLPLQPDPGETLTLEAGGWRPRHIVNGAHWLVASEDGGIRLGATHAHDRTDARLTVRGRRELLAGWRALRPQSPSPRVVRHQAGVRPGTADHYPLLGAHPQYPSLWVFNGFGARGALSIPWYAERLGDHLDHGMPLPPEADIGRFR